MLRRTILVLALAASALTACDRKPEATAPAASAQLRKVKLLLDWRAEPTYAAFYIAKERGEFAKRGLDVELVEGSGATTSAQLIAAGTQYVIGSNSGEATAIARSQGLPIKSVAVYYRDVPTVIYSRADTPIRTPKDLVGRRMGLISGSITTDEYRALASANNLDRSKVKEVGAGFDVAPLLTKQVDGLMNYAELTPVELRLQGHKIETLRLADYGVHAYSLNLIANDKILQSDPKMVADVTAATNAGFAFVRENPAEAARIFSSLFPDKSPEYVRQSIAVVAGQIAAPAGEQTREGWQTTLNTLGRLGLLKRPVTVEEVADARYLAPSK